MLAFRQSLAAGAPVAEIARRSDELRGLLLRAQGAVQERSLGPGVAFASSLIILLREGLEAILILGAIFAFLVRSERREALVYVHYGWIARSSRAPPRGPPPPGPSTSAAPAREVTEGATALLAAGILFYVGFWLHQASTRGAGRG
jgi:high-affinity iron transporter